MSKSSVSTDRPKGRGIPGVKVRKIRAGDITEIVSIHESLRQIKVPRKWILMVKGLMEGRDRIGFVALKDSHIVGFIFGEIKGEGFGLEQSGWINWVGVHPKEMGKEIGRTLSREIFRFFNKKGIRDVYTSVRWDSADMLSFFKSVGFDRSPFINLIRHLD
jgi:ribosomal protein S18 acetylase RimI-like enzyme